MRRYLMGFALAAACGGLLGLPGAASAAACRTPDALGPSRVLYINPHETPGVGSKQHLPALPLQAHEIVLTFDDGPRVDATPGILDALAKECVHATFFEIGRRAKAAPELSRRTAAEGHTIGSHSWSHPNLAQLAPPAATDEIGKGVDAVEAADGQAPPAGAPRLFRFPDGGMTPETLDYLRAHDMAVIGIDMNITDWGPKVRPPEELLASLKAQLDQHDRGILVMHEMPGTAAALPALLQEMKARHIRIVQLVAR